MIKQAIFRYSMPVVLPTKPHSLPPSSNTLKKCTVAQSFHPHCGVSGAHRVGMKEALSKSVILERLVNASRLKAGNAEHSPLVVVTEGRRCAANVLEFLKR